MSFSHAPFTEFPMWWLVRLHRLGARTDTGVAYLLKPFAAAGHAA